MTTTVTPVNDRVTITMSVKEYDAMERVLKAADDYIDLRDRIAGPYAAPEVRHASKEGVELNLAVKALNDVLG